MRSSDGQPTWALHGLLTSMRLAVDVGATHVVVAADPAGGCPWRREMHPGYKAHRSESAIELKQQLVAYPALLEAIGIGVSCVEGWEADDVLASLASYATSIGGKSVVVTNDRDAYQLISDTCTVIRPDGGIVLDAKLVTKHGVGANLYRHIAALRGEPGDGIPGIPGVGEKTAGKLVAAFRHEITAAVDNETLLKTVVTPRIAKIVVENADLYRRNLTLGNLADNLDVKAAFNAGALPLDAHKVADACKPFGLERASELLIRQLATPQIAYNALLELPF